MSTTNDIGEAAGLASPQGASNNCATSRAGAGTPELSSDGSMSPIAPMNPLSPEEETKKKQLGVLYGAVLDDIEIGTEEVYPTVKNGTTMTKLKAVKAILVADIKAHTLRNWAVSIGIQCRKGFKKEDTCRAILSTKATRERLASAGGSIGLLAPTLATAGVVAEDTANRILINHVRFINVLSEEEVKPLLLSRGKQKTRHDLDNGADPDAILWETIAGIYNDTDNESILQMKWQIAWGNSTPDPSSYTPISPAPATSGLKTLSSNYETAFTNWKKSGWHEGIPTKPFVDFVGSCNYLDYLHAYFQETPGICNTVCATLPDDVFNEGTGERPPKRMRRPNKSDTTSMATIAMAQEQKAASISYHTHQASYNDLEEKVLAAKTRRRALIQQLKVDPAFRGKGSKYIKRYLAKVKAEMSQKELESDDDEQFFSQQTVPSGDIFDDHRMLAEEFVTCEDSIDAKEQQMIVLKGKIDAYLLGMNKA